MKQKKNIMSFAFKSCAVTCAFLLTASLCGCGISGKKAEKASANQNKSVTVNNMQTYKANYTAPVQEKIDLANTNLQTTKNELNLTDEIVQRSLISEGNRSRLASVMSRALNGEEITVGVIGGSITHGAAAEPRKEKSYAALYAQWWRDTFPEATINFVNAGVGSTDSMYGVHRSQEDLLSQNPDVIIIEYGVNDYETDECRIAYESIVRRCLKQANDPAVMLMFFMTGGSDVSMDSRQAYQSTIGEYYNLPMISFYSAMAPEVESGRIPWDSIETDNVHPNTYGHACAGYFIKNYLTKVYSELSTINDEELIIPTQPKVSDAFENGILLHGKNFNASDMGNWFKLDNALFEGRTGWGLDDGSTPISFDVAGYKTVYLQYKRAAGMGKALVTVNGVNVMTIDANEARTDKPAVYLKIAEDSSENKHIVITPQPSGDLCAFIILGLMASGNSATISADDSINVDFGDLIYPIGDIDCDEAVNTSDMASLKKSLIGSSNIKRTKSADTNADGSVDIKDLVRLKKHFADLDVKLGK